MPEKLEHCDKILDDKTPQLYGGVRLAKMVKEYHMFKGSITALITPFRDKQLDFGAFEKLVNWQIESGTQGLVVCGSTGEGFLLSVSEQKALINLAVKTANKRIPIIAAAASFTTESTIELCHQAEKSGADYLMVLTPPYIKPTQEALYHYYASLHEATHLPIMIYNNPGRVGGIFVNDDTLCRLAELPRILGVKDCTGCMIRPTNLRHRLGPDFIILSGDDPTTPAFLAQGGDGAISMTANVAPQACAQLIQAWKNADLVQFKQLRDALMPLNQALIIEPNPIPVKYALSKLGLCQNELRAPLMPLAKALQFQVDSALEHLQANFKGQMYG